MLGVDRSAFAEGAKAHDEKSVVVATGADGVGLQWQHGRAYGGVA